MNKASELKDIKTQATDTILSTGYVMSSWDIADVMEMEHGEALEIILTATADCFDPEHMEPLLGSGSDDEEVTGFLFDLKGALILASELTALSGDNGCEEAIIVRIARLQEDLVEGIGRLIATIAECYTYKGYETALDAIVKVLIERNTEVTALRSENEKLKSRLGVVMGGK